MVTEHTIDRTRWHAGLTEGVASDCQPLFVVVKTEDFAALEVSASDCLATLDTLNHELNGPVPSETIGGDDNIPRLLVYAIVEIVRQMWEAEIKASDSYAKQLALERIRIDTAWNLVLCGDIDDLVPEVDMELRAQEGKI